MSCTEFYQRYISLFNNSILTFDVTSREILLIIPRCSFENHCVNSVPAPRVSSTVNAKISGTRSTPGLLRGSFSPRRWYASNENRRSSSNSLESLRAQSATAFKLVKYWYVYRYLQQMNARKSHSPISAWLITRPRTLSYTPCGVLYIQFVFRTNTK